MSKPVKDSQRETLTSSSIKRNQSFFSQYIGLRSSSSESEPVARESAARAAAFGAARGERAVRFEVDRAEEARVRPEESFLMLLRKVWGGRRERERN